MPYSLVSAIAEPFESVTSATDFPPEIVRHADEVSLVRLPTSLSAPLRDWKY